jgi:hypothetical protein
VLEDGLHTPEAAAGKNSGLLGFAGGEWSVDDRLRKRVAWFGSGASADRADSVPREKDGDGADG